MKSIDRVVNSEAIISKDKMTASSCVGIITYFKTVVLSFFSKRRENAYIISLERTKETELLNVWWGLRLFGRTSVLPTPPGDNLAPMPARASDENRPEVPFIKSDETSVTLRWHIVYPAFKCVC